MNDKNALVAFHNPHDLKQGMELANMLAKSELIPNALRNKPADVLLVLMKGNELGLLPMQALSLINVIQGKPVIAAEAMAALVRSNAPICRFLRMVESTDTIATFETQRAGDPEPTRLSYSIEDAKKAGLSGKDNWVKQPKTMLRWRALSAICRLIYPDLTQGLSTPEEMEEVAERDITPDRVAPPLAVAPAPEPEDAETEEVAKPATPAQSEVDAIRAAIAEAKAKTELRALIQRINALAEADKNIIRDVYGARLKELTDAA